MMRLEALVMVAAVALGGCAGIPDEVHVDRAFTAEEQADIFRASQEWQTKTGAHVDLVWDGHGERGREGIRSIVRGSPPPECSSRQDDFGMHCVKWSALGATTMEVIYLKADEIESRWQSLLHVAIHELGHHFGAVDMPDYPPVVMSANINHLTELTWSDLDNYAEHKDEAR